MTATRVTLPLPLCLIDGSWHSHWFCGLLFQYLQPFTCCNKVDFFDVMCFLCSEPVVAFVALYSSLSLSRSKAKYLLVNSLIDSCTIYNLFSNADEREFRSWMALVSWIESADQMYQNKISVKSCVHFLQHNKAYVKDFDQRLQIFTENKRRIDKHNEGNHSFTSKNVFGTCIH